VVDNFAKNNTTSQNSPFLTSSKPLLNLLKEKSALESIDPEPPQKVIHKLSTTYPPLIHHFGKLKSLLKSVFFAVFGKVIHQKVVQLLLL
jgi:hypothetical protein